LKISEILVKKRDGTTEKFNEQKIIEAVNKSASRVMKKLSVDDYEKIIELVLDEIFELSSDRDEENFSVEDMHNAVEYALESFDSEIAKSYKDYRNYKRDFVHMMDEVYTKSQSIRYIGDKSNANTDSALVATKRSLIYNELSGELYKKFFLTSEERQAAKEGYIYIHDRSSRLDTFNCCLADIGSIMKGGFEMGNVWYNEPNYLDTAFDVMGDIILSTAAQQYGGFTVPEVDKILEPYAEKSYWKYRQEYAMVCGYIERDNNIKVNDTWGAEEYAINKVRRDFDQGWQGIEYKLNTVGSSRGDYPFVTVTIGLGTQRFEKMCNISLLNVHKGGQGRPGNKKPVLFPKIVFLYDEKLHGVGGECEDVFEAGVACSAKTMYPDWLSMTGKGYISSMYKQYKKVISPMGCRAFLSPWYERGGMYPADDKDVPVFTGRFNIGAVSLHLPMILAKARSESRDFYEVLDYYLEMIRNLHKRTYEYLGAMKASTNPLAYCEGGFYGGHLKPNERIKKLLKPMTASFGITALNELQELYNGKSITEDGEFALEVLEYINKKVSEFKEEDGWLYAIYGTPAESLCGLQVEQFRKKYGIVENVSDRPYVSNSFHCHVTEDITPIEKQDLEGRFWELCNGGKIQYVRYPIDYNVQAIKSLIRRAMDLGYYEGVNLSLAYCDDCGHQELEMDVCPKCGSKNLTKIDRMNGYLSYSRVHGDTRLNEAKMAEIAERKSM
jgi:ribonucleoside-triphosphate reductase